MKKSFKLRFLLSFLVVATLAVTFVGVHIATAPVAYAASGGGCTPHTHPQQFPFSPPYQVQSCIYEDIYQEIVSNAYLDPLSTSGWTSCQIYLSTINAYTNQQVGIGEGWNCLSRLQGGSGSYFYGGANPAGTGNANYAYYTNIELDVSGQGHNYPTYYLNSPTQYT